MLNIFKRQKNNSIPRRKREPFTVHEITDFSASNGHSYYTLKDGELNSEEVEDAGFGVEMVIAHGRGFIWLYDTHTTLARIKRYKHIIAVDFSPLKGPDSIEFLVCEDADKAKNLEFILHNYMEFFKK